MDVPVEERFRVLCEITRAQHFAWREAALALAPHLDPGTLTRKMWEITGAQTAKAYLKRLDPGQPLAPQVSPEVFAFVFVFSEIEFAEGIDRARGLLALVLLVEDPGQVQAESRVVGPFFQQRAQVRLGFVVEPFRHEKPGQRAPELDTAGHQFHGPLEQRDRFIVRGADPL